MKLYPNQQEVVDEAAVILDKWDMVYLALYPRFGKSPISLTLASGNTLFVTTKSAVSGVDKVIAALGKKDVTVTTYGSLHKVVDIYDTLILDEAHTNISSFPNMSKSREKLDVIVEKNPKIKVIWLSGSPSIESGSKLYHQLSVSPKHSFSKFNSFHEWFNPKGHYADPHKGGGYGIYGLTKFTGGSRPAVDYSQTKDFSNKYDPIMIRRSEEEEKVNIIKAMVEPAPAIDKAMREIRTKQITMIDNLVFIAEGGASKLSKAHQLAGGTAIDDRGESHILCHKKAQKVYNNHGESNVCVFYKYVKEKELLSQYFSEEHLFQIDSNCTGIDMSHYDEMVIYSLTWSGSTYTQVLSRLVNVNKKDIPNIFIYLTLNSPDEKIYEAVSRKKDFNTAFLSKK